MKQDKELLYYLPFAQEKVKQLRIEKERLIEEGLNIKAMLENSYNSKQEHELMLIKARIIEINQELKRYK